MLSTQLLIIFLIPTVLLLACIGYLTFRYVPIVSRIFEEKPLFHPLRLDPPGEGENVVFPSMDGTRLHGTYLHARTPRRKGVIVFCHEFLSDRWSYQPYVDHLRDEISSPWIFATMVRAMTRTVTNHFSGSRVTRFAICGRPSRIFGLAPTGMRRGSVSLV